VRDLVQRASFLRAIKDSGFPRALFFIRGREIYPFMPSSESSHQTARRLRREQTPAEQILWRHLRGSRMCNLKFRRQFPIGPYFADFCSTESQLVIELDGGQHADRANEDHERSSFLNSLGYRVLRFWNNQVLENPVVVLTEIEKFLSSYSSLVIGKDQN